MSNASAVRNEIENGDVRKNLQKIQKLVQDIERFRHKALPPLPTNVKGAESHYKSRPRRSKLPDFSNLDLPMLSEDLRKNIMRYYQYSKVLMRNQKLRNQLQPLYKQKRKPPVITRISLNYAQLVKPAALRNLRLRSTEARSTGGANKTSETKARDSSQRKRSKSHSAKKLLNANQKENDGKRISSNNNQEITGDRYNSKTFKNKISRKQVGSDITLKAPRSSLDVVNVHHNRSLPVQRAIKPNKGTVVNKKPNTKRRRGKRSKQVETQKPCEVVEIPEPKKPKTVDFEEDYSKIMDKYRVKSRDTYPKSRACDVLSLEHRPFQSTPSEVLKRILTVRVPHTEMGYDENETVRRPFHSYERLEKEARYAEKVRLAVIGGGSRDPSYNERLSKVVETALSENVSSHFLDATINSCKGPGTGEKSLKILQIELGGGIYILCTAYTCHFSLLKKALDGALKRYNARFSPVLQHFTSCPVITAIAPPYTCINCQPNTPALRKDAYELDVVSIDILNFDTRAVAIRCEQASMFGAVRALPKKGYEIKNIDFGFKAKEFIAPMGNDFNMYWRFLAVLEELDDIDSVTDNVY
uniref:TACO1/YebC-like second and third domain-containing protein n=1 Tax=Glossina austeni TaxID=7395 RepID=A0A1A9VEY9_GLOAU